MEARLQITGMHTHTFSNVELFFNYKFNLHFKLQKGGENRTPLTAVLIQSKLIITHFLNTDT